MRNLLAVLTSATLAGCSVSSSATPHWGYSGAEGPEQWGSLTSEFGLCATGKNQSPIDLANFVEADLDAIEFDYSTRAMRIRNNGHTIQADYARGSQITVDGFDFTLLQFHFHTPSENLLEGRSFPLEVHLVHADAQGNLAVIGVFFEEGESNPALAALWERMPRGAGQSQDLGAGVAADGILPAIRDVFRFSGSLTTPPCSEGVRWLVMKNPLTASRAQIDSLRAVLGHANNRPLQPTNARLILE